jgi:preprotein translocase subunit SecF
MSTGTEVSHEEMLRLNKAIHSGSFLSRLTTGTGAFNIIGRRRYYYMFSTVLVVGSILMIALRGFNLGTDFAGGTTLTFVPSAGAANVSNSSVTKVIDDALGAGTAEAVQTLGGSTIQVTMKVLPEQSVAAGKAAITKAFTPTGGVSGSNVSSSWGAQISERAILAVVVFLIAVGLLIWIRYEKRVAIGAVGSTLHDVLVTAGIYSLTGFEVTPATVVGLLTILGFSLYDTVVVYDKVEENSKGMMSLLRRTYPETANLAVNQTLMRSLNTSLIALLPVAGLLVAGVAVLGGGTLKDLALVLLVGMLVGAYSSIFVAVPVAVDLKIRQPIIKAHTARVLAKRRHDGLIVDADGDPIGRKVLPGMEPVKPTRVGVPAVPVSGLKAGAPPKPGVKPVRPGKQTSSRAAVPGPVVSTPSPVGPMAGSSLYDPGAQDAMAAATEPALTPEGAAAATPVRAPKPAGKAARPTGKRGR